MQLIHLGGLTTSFTYLKANLLISILVALTGIGFPIAFSYLLIPLANATPLQAFTAGAALCSTSLGTTLTVINTSGLSGTRLGVVLTSAAMMDDVVGLVMVQVISNLGDKGSSIESATIVRPIFVSLAFSIVLPLVCRFVIVPGTKALNQAREANAGSKFNQLLSRNEATLVIHAALLAVLVTGASYAGTSNLLAAYLAGVVISWWDSDVPHAQISPQTSTPQTKDSERRSTDQPKGGNSLDETMVRSAESSEPQSASNPNSSYTHASIDGGAATYEHYYQQGSEKILKPFFFASIGFSIPISKMFLGKVVWKGLVYTILMMIGKLMCGVWLFRISFPATSLSKISKSVKSSLWLQFWGCQATQSSSSPVHDYETRNHEGSAPEDHKNQSQNPGSTVSGSDNNAQRPDEPRCRLTSRSPRKPLSLYASAILGSAMVARGEIGFLISSLAQSKGIFDTSSPNPSEEATSEIFLLVTWAIFLCTLAGPLCVGALVRRVKKLEKNSAAGNEGTEGKRDVLGVWGVR